MNSLLQRGEDDAEYAVSSVQLAAHASDFVYDFHGSCLIQNLVLTAEGLRVVRRQLQRSRPLHGFSRTIQSCFQKSSMKFGVPFAHTER